MTTATAPMQILHVGCGRRRYSAPALLDYIGLSLHDTQLQVTHLDADPRLEPDLVCRLGDDPIPLADNSVDLIVAWHVLEHIGKQGESEAWFRFWEDAYRVLTPNGMIYAESPYYTGIWAWSDPTHTRALSEHSLLFFCQDAYRAKGSMISPYRVACDFIWAGMPGLEKGWAVLTSEADPREQSLRFALAARKPLKPWWED